MVAGLTSAGANVLRVGVLPTPAVAYLTARPGADLGVMLSASHNPMPDNGIKLFAAGGHKLAGRGRGRDRGGARTAGPGRARPAPRIGRVPDAADGAERYVAHLLGAAAAPARRAARWSSTAPTARPSRWRRRPTARPAPRSIAINAEPDGLNINDGCGSTHLGRSAAAVVEHGADLGIAHDGDADRCLAVDADRRRSSTATRSWRSSPSPCATPARCVDDTLVATVMSNLGLQLPCAAPASGCCETKVGDRYVLEELRAGGLRPRRRAERARRHAGVRHHRRRRADRAAPDGPDGRRPAGRWPTSPRSCSGCRRC